MVETDMGDDRWAYTQAVARRVSLNDFTDEDFLKKLKNAFGDSKLNVINISFLIEKDENSELVSLTHKSSEFTENSKVLVDSADSKTLAILKNIL